MGHVNGHGNRARTLHTHATAALSCAVGLVLLAGCDGGPGRLARQREWVDLNPNAPERIRRAVLGKKLVQGMTEKAIIASWGEPDRKTRLGSADARWSYVRPQVGDGVRYDIEYILVLKRGVLISVLNQIRR
jgi:hypothetical protein